MTSSETRFKPALTDQLPPVLFLVVLILYALVLRPYAFGLPVIPLEIIFILAAAFTGGWLCWRGYAWEALMKSAIAKITKGLPTLLILFCIGMVIGSWIVSGIIPMLVYYGINLVNPDYIYVLAFIVPIFFSLTTGTSWGSVGTIGVVILGVATAVNADLAIVAGAVIGGAVFGDKMSPLSDTTNIAALATGVDLYDHIRSMLWTTIPSAVIAATIYTLAGFWYPPVTNTGDFAALERTTAGIAELFRFNALLLLPVVIVLIGSFRRWPTIPVLLASVISACLLGLIFQDYTPGDVAQAVYKGYDTTMAPWALTVPDNVAALFNRGGLYALIEAITVALLIFFYIGLLDVVNAIPALMGRVFAFAQRRAPVIISSLFAAAFSNLLTSNQYATSFIVGEAFAKKYDDLGIDRSVLSRSIEDYGNMIESIIPWHPTALFMVSVLGVGVGEYWNWQLLTLVNLGVAVVLAVTGIGVKMRAGPRDAVEG